MSSHPLDGPFEGGKLPKECIRVGLEDCQRTRFGWVRIFNRCEQLRQRDAQRFGDLDQCGETEILPACFQVTNERPVQAAIICKILLRFETSLDAKFPDTQSEAFENLFHSQGVFDSGY